MSVLSGELSFLDGAYGGADQHEKLWIEKYGDTEWMVNNSSFADYSRRAYILGYPEGLSDLVDEQIGKNEDNVGLDIAAGSNAVALRNLVGSGVLGLALATNYENLMPNGSVGDGRVHQITGNLTREETWHEIREWKEAYAEQGFALAMHRPIGGLQELHPDTYTGAAHFVLDLVQEGGLLFTQVPFRLVREQWALRTICKSIRSRPDVAEVLLTEGRPPQHSCDEDDLYAAIIKA